MSGCHGLTRVDNRLHGLCFGCDLLGKEPRTVMPSIRRDEQGVAVCSHRVIVIPAPDSAMALKGDGKKPTTAGAGT